MGYHESVVMNEVHSLSILTDHFKALNMIQAVSASMKLQQL